MAKLKSLMDEESTDLIQDTPKQREEKKLLERLEEARRKEIKYNDLVNQFEGEQMDELVKRKVLHPKYGVDYDLPLEEVRARMTPTERQQEADVITELAKKRAKLELGEAVDEGVSPISSLKKSAAAELAEAGAQGNIISNQLRKAGINIDDLSLDEATQQLKRQRESSSKMSSLLDKNHPIIGKEGLLSAGEKGITEPSFNRVKSLIEKGKAAQELQKKVGSAVKGGSIGLGALATALDLSKGNIPEAALDVTETGLGLAGGLAARGAPALELLRSTPTQTKEQEEQELEKAKFNQLRKSLAKRGLTSEI